MAMNSKIGWTHHTHNPWWGCVKIDPACTNCYAHDLDGRYNADDPHWGLKARRKFMSDSYWKQPLKWNRLAAAAGERHRVFCASMADVFELLPDGHPDIDAMEEARQRLWQTILDTPWLDWLLLTKRPENFSGMLPWDTVRDEPYENVWLGVTAGTQEAADRNIPILWNTSAVCRFVSYEPALEPVDFSRHIDRCPGCREGIGCLFPVRCSAHVDWVIAGAESGPKRRPMELDWVRAVRDQCALADVAFFFKQAIIDGRKVELPELDGVVWDEVPTPA